MEPKDYWKIKHAKYATEDWINKPSIFAQFAVSYFKENLKGIVNYRTCVSA